MALHNISTANNQHPYPRAEQLVDGASHAQGKILKHTALCSCPTYDRLTLYHVAKAQPGPLVVFLLYGEDTVLYVVFRGKQRRKKKTRDSRKIPLLGTEVPPYLTLYLLYLLHAVFATGPKINRAMKMDSGTLEEVAQALVREYSRHPISDFVPAKEVLCCAVLQTVLCIRIFYSCL